MSNYVEIMNRINELDEQRKKLRIERLNEISSLYDYRRKYPYQFADLPGNPDNLEPEDIEVVLGIAKYRLKNTPSINEEERTEIINQINIVNENVAKINERYNEIDEIFINEIAVEKARREEYLEEVYNKTEDLVNQISKIEQSVELHRKGLEEAIEKGYEVEIIQSFESVITKKQNEIGRLTDEIRIIYSESGLKEEIELYKEEKTKIEKQELERLEREKQEKFETEKKQRIEEIRRKAAISKIEEIEKEQPKREQMQEESKNNEEVQPERITPVVDEKPKEPTAEKTEDSLTKREQFAKTLEEYKKSLERFDTKTKEEQENIADIEEPQQEETKDTPEEVQEKSSTPEEKTVEKEKSDIEKIEPLIPEKPKKVVSKHKASEKLIAAVKKYGGRALGITAIGVATILISGSPMLGVLAGTAGLAIYNKIEKMNKGRLK